MRTGVLISIGVVLIGVVIAYNMITSNLEEQSHMLPVIQPKDVKQEMVDIEIAGKSIGHRIQKFEFFNQNGGTTTLDDVKGKVFVAEYFFTTCPTICPIMNEEMKKVQAAFKGNSEVKILSFTVDPENDTIEAMKKYAEEHGAIDNQWYFLTGEKEKLYNLARKSFFVLKPAEAENLGDAGSDFIHTNNFVLVDQELRIRGYYDGTDEGEVSQLIEDIQFLLDTKN